MKPFVNGDLRSVSRLLGAGLSLLLPLLARHAAAALAPYGATPAGVERLLPAACSVVFGLVWFADVLRARVSYTAAFYSSLVRGHADFSSPYIEIAPDQITLVRGMLEEGDEHQVVFFFSDGSL